MSPQEYEWLTEAQAVELEAWRELGAERAKNRGGIMNLITEALIIAKDNFDFDGEYKKSKLIAELLKEIEGD